MQFDTFASLFCVDVFPPWKECRHQVHQPRSLPHRVHRSPFSHRSIEIPPDIQTDNFFLPPFPPLHRVQSRLSTQPRRSVTRNVEENEGETKQPSIFILLIAEIEIEIVERKNRKDDLSIPVILNYFCFFLDQRKSCLEGIRGERGFFSRKSNKLAKYLSLILVYTRRVDYDRRKGDRSLLLIPLFSHSWRKD